MSPALTRRRRWTVPALALAGVLGFGAVPNLFPASGAVPVLPRLSPAALLAKAQTAHVTALSGTIRLTSRLGLPSLGSLGSLGGGSAVSLTSLLAGSHEVQLWLNGPDHVRISQAAPLAETVWVRNGTDLWSWDSTAQRVTHVVSTTGMTKPSADHDAATPVQTPAALAQELLAQVTPSTEVSVRSPRYLAGQAVYELVLTPKSAASTIRDVTISVDSVTGLPLDVRITPRASKAVAFELGFTKLSYATPSAALFAFRPPPGSTVIQAKRPQALLAPGAPDQGRHHRVNATTAPPTATTTAPTTVPTTPSHVVTVGTDWATVAIISGVRVPSAVNDLVRSAPQVSVGSTTGRLITTTLFSVLILNDGRIAVGAVTPAALEAAVGAASA